MIRSNTSCIAATSISCRIELDYRVIEQRHPDAVTGGEDYLPYAGVGYDESETKWGWYSCGCRVDGEWHSTTFIGPGSGYSLFGVLESNGRPYAAEIFEFDPRPSLWDRLWNNQPSTFLRALDDVNTLRPTDEGFPYD